MEAFGGSVTGLPSGAIGAGGRGGSGVSGGQELVQGTPATCLCLPVSHWSTYPAMCPTSPRPTKGTCTCCSHHSLVTARALAPGGCASISQKGQILVLMCAHAPWAGEGGVRRTPLGSFLPILRLPLAEDLPGPCPSCPGAGVAPVTSCTSLSP